MQDRIARIDENLLHRTAGPYIWVATFPVPAVMSGSAGAGLRPNCGTDAMGQQETPALQNKWNAPLRERRQSL